MSVWTRRAALSAAFIAASIIASPVSAQTKLKWAHVYEVAEPYHTQAVWAAGEIKKLTNGKYDGEWLAVSDKSAGRVGIISMKDLKTKLIFKTPNTVSDHQPNARCLRTR